VLWVKERVCVNGVGAAHNSLLKCTLIHLLHSRLLLYLIIQMQKVCVYMTLEALDILTCSFADLCLSALVTKNNTLVNKFMLLMFC
jgi:hypothetical protein